MVHGFHCGSAMASAVHLDEAMQAVGFGKDFHSQGMGGGVEVLWKLIGRRFEWEASFLISATMKGSRGCVKLIDAMGKAVRMTVDVGNSCGDDGPVLGAL
jgi:hypothetical protein